MLPHVRFFKVGSSQGDGQNPYINHAGVFLGNGRRMVARGVGGYWAPESRDGLETALGKGEYAARASSGLRRVARALNEGDEALAYMELVLLRLPQSDSGGGASLSPIREAIDKYDPLQPREPAGQSNGGQWTSDLEANSECGAPHPSLTDVNFVDAAYNGGYHDQVVASMAAHFRSLGIPTETEVPLTTIDGNITAIADIMIMNPVTEQRFVLEIKTGDDPTFTFSQAYIYPLAAIGWHVLSESPKISTLGFFPGKPLPPLSVEAVYAIPGKEYKVIPLIPQFGRLAQSIAIFNRDAFEGAS